MNKETTTKLQKAEKEIKEAEDAVLDAAESADDETKESLTRAEMALEKAESEVDDSLEK